MAIEGRDVARVALGGLDRFIGGVQVRREGERAGQQKIELQGQREEQLTRRQEIMANKQVAIEHIKQQGLTTRAGTVKPKTYYDEQGFPVAPDMMEQYKAGGKQLYEKPSARQKVSSGASARPMTEAAQMKMENDNLSAYDNYINDPLVEDPLPRDEWTKEKRSSIEYGHLFGDSDESGAATPGPEPGKRDFSSFINKQLGTGKAVRNKTFKKDSANQSQETVETEKPVAMPSYDAEESGYPAPITYEDEAGGVPGEAGGVSVPPSVPDQDQRKKDLAAFGGNEEMLNKFYESESTQQTSGEARKRAIAAKKFVEDVVGWVSGSKQGKRPKIRKMAADHIAVNVSIPKSVTEKQLTSVLKRPENIDTAYEILKAIEENQPTEELINRLFSK